MNMIMWLHRDIVIPSLKEQPKILKLLSVNQRPWHLYIKFFACKDTYYSI